MLQRELTSRHVQAQIDSAGTSAVADAAPTADAISVMHAEGLDISAHRSQPIEAIDLDRADVIITMTRAHLRVVATRSPMSFPRLFTLKELARRARTHPPRTDEEVRAWVTRLGAGRRTTDLLGDDPLDDVEDPIGSPIDVYSAVAKELAAAVADVVNAGWPAALEGP